MADKEPRELTAEEKEELRRREESAWIRALIAEHHKTRDDLINFLYEQDWPYGLQYEAIQLVEEEKLQPLEAWNRFRVWIKICYAMSLAGQYKGTGNVIFYNINGTHLIKLKYFKGEYKKW